VEEESKWIELSRAGSAEAFAQLVLLHQVRVRGYIGRYLRNKDVVDDLAQEAFLDAFRRLNTYQGEGPLALWLVGIARNCVLEHMRGEMRRRSREARHLETALALRRLQQAEADAGRLGDREREISALQDCIRNLPETGARLLAEHYFQSRSAVEIARKRGGKEGAIRMALLRVRQMLRECIERTMAAEGGA